MASQSGLIKPMLVDEDEDLEIPLLAVSTHIMKHILKFCKYHAWNRMAPIQETWLPNN